MSDFLEAEVMPESCPPANASELERQEAYRFVEASDVTIDDFKSKAALGLSVPPNMCACKWASCSLIPGEYPNSKIRKLPLFKHRNFMARVQIDEQSGIGAKTERHIDLWMYATFDPTSAVKEIIPIGPDSGFG